MGLGFKVGRRTLRSPRALRPPNATTCNSLRLQKGSIIVSSLAAVPAPAKTIFKPCETLAGHLRRAAGQHSEELGRDRCPGRIATPGPFPGMRLRCKKFLAKRGGAKAATRWKPSCQRLSLFARAVAWLILRFGCTSPAGQRRLPRPKKQQRQRPVRGLDLHEPLPETPAKNPRFLYPKLHIPGFFL